MSGQPCSPHVDYRPGWEYLNLALDDDGVLTDEFVAAFHQVIMGALGDHPYRLYRGDRWAVVAVAPPATLARGLLEEAFATELGAVVDEPWPDDDSHN